MCGIFCEICFNNVKSNKDAIVLKRIRNRGPNSARPLELVLGDGIIGFFYATVLWMQGPKLLPQPVEHDNGVLLYNGDIFDETWDSNLCDTQLIAQNLIRNDQCSERHIIEQLRLLKGPFAMIYYDKINRKLYFTRDRIGRSSLLFHKTKSSFIISSVLGRDYDCVEIPATHIHVLHVANNRITLYQWGDTLDSDIELSLDDWITQIKVQQSLPDDEFKFDFVEEDLADEEDIIRYINSTAQQLKCRLSILKQLLQHTIIDDTILNIVRLLENSVKLRLKRQPNKCKICLDAETISCKHCTVGVLFSGGLDCTILALLADKFLPEDQNIDLINVAFKKDDKTSYEVPDRLTGKQSLLELQTLCPNRKWVFREVNVSKEELDKYQESIIGDLVYPRQTILDESLGSALWFAAKGEDQNGESTCRILLVGSGADELFGGYIRHRNAFKRNGWLGLSNELQLDWKRISFRNLARDNRVICDHGRQPRMPYLDEDFTQYVLQLKPWLRCFPSEELGVGIGDKIMLRLVATYLGITDAAVLPKRALQFGSRIANKKEKGSDISKTFLQNKKISIS